MSNKTKTKARRPLKISIHGHDLDIEAKIADSRLAEVLADAINRVTNTRATASATPTAATPLALLISEFKKSLRTDQVELFMNSLEMGQKVMFMEIMTAAKDAHPEN